MPGALLLFLSESIKKIKILSKQTNRTIFTHPFLYKWGVGGGAVWRYLIVLEMDTHCPVLDF
jgi:hypothetical protein